MYLTLAPQLLVADEVGVMAGWLTTWTALLHRGRRLTRSDRFTIVVDRVGGVVLVALGLRTATS